MGVLTGAATSVDPASRVETIERLERALDRAPDRERVGSRRRHGVQPRELYRDRTRPLGANGLGRVSPVGTDLAGLDPASLPESVSEHKDLASVRGIGLGVALGAVVWLGITAAVIAILG